MNWQPISNYVLRIDLSDVDWVLGMRDDFYWTKVRKCFDNWVDETGAIQEITHFMQIEKPISDTEQDLNDSTRILRLYKNDSRFLMITCGTEFILVREPFKTSSSTTMTVLTNVLKGANVRYYEVVEDEMKEGTYKYWLNEPSVEGTLYTSTLDNGDFILFSGDPDNSNPDEITLTGSTLEKFTKLLDEAQIKYV